MKRWLAYFAAYLFVSITGHGATLDLGDGVTMDLVWIPSGEFIMGSPESETGRYSDESPPHHVIISKGYWMGKYEVTQAQWEKVMGNNPSNWKGSELPVENVSWDNCQEFLTRLNQQLSISNKYLTVRLPTEAEWEYACRAGTTTRFNTGDADSDLDRAGWYLLNSGTHTHSVGGKDPNQFGLHDMHGNVWEWCQDWFGAYSSDDAIDPTGPSEGTERVLRGGSWGGFPRDCRSSVLRNVIPSSSYNDRGFRICAQTQISVAPTGAGTVANPYLICEPGNLVWMGENVGSSSGQYYTVQNDIDASETTNWNGGEWFVPIGNDVTNFTGIFYGNGWVIRNLIINRPGQNYVGLFGYVGNGGVVKDIGLEGGSVTGSNYVGGLMGCNNAGVVTNCNAAVAITGNNYIGGLVGYNSSGATISGCYAMSAAGGNEYVGGLVGNNMGWVNGCYAAGPVTGISGSYHGGLVGYNSGTVIDSYATGSVTDSVSGIDGFHHGGLVGYNSGLVRRGYAAGLVTPCNFAGGLVGRNLGTVDNAYWDEETSGLVYSQGGTGTNTAAMKQQSTFAGWNFTNVWSITNGMTYPFFAISTRIIGVSGPLAFGNVTMGQTAMATLTITNSGNTILTVSSIIYPSSFSGAWSGTLGAGKTTNVTVTFAPLALTTYSGTITVNSDKTGGKSTTNCSGTGVGVIKSNQTITFTNPGDKLRAARVVLRANASSGLPVKFVVTSGPGVVTSSSNLSFTGIGTVRVAARQPGNASWNAAPQVVRIIVVSNLAMNDYDGDGINDLAIFSAAGGIWAIKYSGGGSTNISWGFQKSTTVCGDYDGDGRDDLAVFYNVTGRWYIRTVAGKMLAYNFAWGWPGATPVSGDYDGDGKDDLAVYDEAAGKWYIWSLAKNKTLAWDLPWGWPGAKPVAGDYDGDGRSDLAVLDVNIGHWYIYSLATANSIAWNVAWGWAGCAYVPGDFDGDKKSDLAVYDQNTQLWYIYSLATRRAIAWKLNFGFAGGIPVSGDYNGDGATDFAVYNPSTGKWYIRDLTGTILMWDMTLGGGSAMPVKP